MSTLNRVMIIGRVGVNPEVKKLTSGTETARFSVATSEKWVDAQGHNQERVEWHQMVCFGNIATLAGKYISKGRQVFCEGRIQTRSYEDKDKVKRYVREIIVSRITLLGAKGELDPSSDPEDQIELPLEIKDKAA